ncbi:MAG TPA: MraY family glycosyltransferase [Steroidobacteraceae bacterium]|nr:MraY family glycosyltransferase [Steroidobacteraceae bacterium]
MQLFLAFVVALSVTAALIPLLARWAPAIGLTDAPGPRKVHSAPVPRVGGLAMAAGLFVATLLTVELSPPVQGLLLGLLVLVLFGLWDDRVNLSYGAKFAGQVIAVGICMFVGDINIGALTFGGINAVPPAISTLITFVFLIGITNAINLADGLDGLAGGMALLCLCAIALFSVASGNTAVTAIALIEAGAVLGFLRFNTHPARVFMGDCGSQMLGLSVGALALLATQGETCALSAALPLLLLGLPIMDTLTVMLTRIRAGRSPFTADRNHLHHRLLNLGFEHREAVFLIYLLQVALVLLAYFLRFELDSQIILTFCAFAAGVLWLLQRATRSGWRLRHVPPVVGIRSYVVGTQSAERIPTLALSVMITCLAVYVLTVVISSGHVGMDLGVLCSGLLLTLLLLTTWRAERSLVWFERGVAYMSVVLLVYLDQTTPHKPPLLTTLSWTFIAITGAAALVRFMLSPTRRFELTTLDVIVIFVALVLPNLPGSLSLPSDLPGGIAKAVILLYVVEMLLTVDLKRMMPRVFLALTLAVIAGRALIGFSA